MHFKSPDREMIHYILGSVLFVVSLVCAEDFSAQREEVLALGKLTAPPNMMAVEGYEREGRLQAIYFNALNYEGKLTKVFAWLGFPEERKGKVPGIVLVHGGGGTAFKQWVKKWNDHGYAAISIAVEGQTDVRNATAKDQDNPSGWQRHAWAGPRRIGIYGDSDEPLKDQWMYHAVADTILANSLLRSLPGVDEGKVGVMGISWGGVITSTVIGIDQRFAFAIPTYGCGHLFDTANQYGRALGKNELYRHVWDPMMRINRAELPVLWLSWPQDQHFPMDCLAACYHAAPGPHLVTLIPGMGHGHGAGWNQPDSYAFAESVILDGKPWCSQISTRANGASLEVVFSSSKALDRAVLISTIDAGFTGNRKWIESPARLQQMDGQWVVTARLPNETTACFVNVKAGNLTVSSEYVELELDTGTTNTLLEER